MGIGSQYERARKRRIALTAMGGAIPSEVESAASDISMTASSPGAADKVESALELVKSTRQIPREIGNPTAQKAK